MSIRKLARSVIRTKYPNFFGMSRGKLSTYTFEDRVTPAGPAYTDNKGRIYQKFANGQIRLMKEPENSAVKKALVVQDV